MLNQSASLEQSGFFCVLFLFLPLLCPVQKGKGRREDSCHHQLSLRREWGGGGRVDGLTDATVLNSLNLGMIKTGKSVPRQVLCSYLCKVLCSAVSEP